MQDELTEISDKNVDSVRALLHLIQIVYKESLLFLVGSFAVVGCLAGLIVVDPHCPALSFHTLQPSTHS